MTPEQQKFLCEFADRELVKIAEENARIAEVEKQREVERARNEYVKSVRAQKDMEVAQAISEFDAKPLDEKLAASVELVAQDVIKG